MYPIEIEKEKASSIVRESKQPPEEGGFVAAEISPVPQFLGPKSNGARFHGGEGVRRMRQRACDVYILGKILLSAWKDATRVKKANASKYEENKCSFYNEGRVFHPKIQMGKHSGVNSQYCGLRLKSS